MKIMEILGILLIIGILITIILIIWIISICCEKMIEQDVDSILSTDDEIINEFFK